MLAGSCVDQLGMTRDRFELIEIAKNILVNE